MDTPLDALRAFARTAPASVCRDAKAFAMEVDYKLVEESNGAFKKRRVKYADGVAMFQCEWQRLNGTLTDLYRDFYSAYAEWICEESQFIQAVVQEKTVVFNVVVGSPGYDVHLLQMHVVGPHVEQALAAPKRGTQARGRRGR
ncbi:MAG TPA: hypothetical protein VII06_04925 [Chloroflexota bacterium]